MARCRELALITGRAILKVWAALDTEAGFHCGCNQASPEPVALFSVLGIEPRTLHMLDECPTTEPQLHPEVSSLQRKPCGHLP